MSTPRLYEAQKWILVQRHANRDQDRVDRIAEEMATKTDLVQTGSAM